MSGAAQTFWSSDSAVGYYLSHRHRQEDLYPSERRFLDDVLQDGGSLLDVGSAAGGLAGVVEGYPRLSYTGVDISERMVDEARNRYPSCRFELTNGRDLDFPDGAFDIVVCFGVLHMTLDWRRLLAECWRVCRGRLLFDARLTDLPTVEDPVRSHQRLAFDGEWDGVSTAPYCIINLDAFMGELAGLKPPFSTLASHGYWHPVSGMTVSEHDRVCMAVFRMDKTGEGRGRIEWDLPLATR